MINPLTILEIFVEANYFGWESDHLINPESKSNMNYPILQI